MLDVLLVGYAVLWLLTVRPLAGHFACVAGQNYPSVWKKNGYKPDAADWAVGTLAALILGILWPLVLLWLLAGSLLPTIGAEKAVQLEVRERRIKQMERDLGLD